MSEKNIPNELTSLRSEEVQKIRSSLTMPQRDSEKKSKWIQISISVMANAAVVSAGMGLGFPAVTIERLKIEGFNDDQISWFASINTLVCPIGGIISATILDLFGRKMTLFVINILSILSWCLLFFSHPDDVDQMFWQVMLGRFLIGVTTGLSSSPAAVYSAEIATPKLRGRLTCLTSLSIALGVLMIYILGFIFPNDWRTTAMLSALFCCFTFILVFFIPESPSWLMSKGRVDQAKSSLARIRAVDINSDVLNFEFEQLTNQIMSRRLASSTSRTSVWEILKSPEVYKPLLIINAFFAFQQLTGTFVIVVYATKFVESASADVDKFFITVLIGVSRVIATFILAFFILDRYGRKPPSIFSGIGMSVSMIMLSIYSAYGDSLPLKSLVTIFLLLAFIITSTLGFLTIPFTMLPEMFPIHVRGVTAGITVSFAYLTSFVAIKLYPTMVSTMGSGAVFLLYGIISIVGTLFVYYILPETKGKTLQEIENLFKSKRLNSDSEAKV